MWGRFPSFDGDDSLTPWESATSLRPKLLMLLEFTDHGQRSLYDAKEDNGREQVG